MGHGEAGGGLRFGVPPENFVPSQSTTPPERNLITRQVAGSIPYQTAPLAGGKGRGRWPAGVLIYAPFKAGIPAAMIS